MHTFLRLIGFHADIVTLCSKIFGFRKTRINMGIARICRDVVFSVNGCLCALIKKQFIEMISGLLDFNVRILLLE